MLILAREAVTFGGVCKTMCVECKQVEKNDTFWNDKYDVKINVCRLKTLNDSIICNLLAEKSNTATVDNTGPV